MYVYLLLFHLLAALPAIAGNTVVIDVPPSTHDNPYFYSESPCDRGQAGCRFAFQYYEVQRRMTYKQPNGATLHVNIGDRIKVSRFISQPGGKVVVRFRTPIGIGCESSSCTLYATWADFKKIPDKTMPGALLRKPRPSAPAEVAKKQSSSESYSLYQKFADAYPTAGNPNGRPCTLCTKANALTPSRKNSGLSKNGDLDRTIAWLGKYTLCKNSKFLQTQRENLARAEVEFRVPAPYLACIIGRESRWDIGADQTAGPFKGLPQADKAALKTIRAYIDDENESIFNEERRNRWDRFTKETLNLDKPLAIGAISTDNIYKDGGKAGSAHKNKLGVVSIAFAAMYLKEIMNRFDDHIRETRGETALANFRSTKTSRYLAGMIGYNAGPAYVDNIMPAQGYTSDNDSWVPKMHAPPYVENARGAVRRACFSPPAKGKKAVPASKRTFRAGRKNQACTRANISAYLNLQAVRAKKKRTEVEQYVKWIDVCAKGNQAVHPPLPGLRSKESFAGGRCQP